jgi:hypothetical protein
MAETTWMIETRCRCRKMRGLLRARDTVVVKIRTSSARAAEF